MWSFKTIQSKPNGCCTLNPPIDDVAASIEEMNLITCNCTNIPKYTHTNMYVHTLLHLEMCEKYYNPEHVYIRTATLHPRSCPSLGPVCSAFAIHCNVWLQSSVITMATNATHSPSTAETMTTTKTTATPEKTIHQSLQCKCSELWGIQLYVYVYVYACIHS